MARLIRSLKPLFIKNAIDQPPVQWKIWLPQQLQLLRLKQTQTVLIYKSTLEDPNTTSEQSANSVPPTTTTTTITMTTTIAAANTGKESQATEPVGESSSPSTTITTAGANSGTETQADAPSADDPPTIRMVGSSLPSNPSISSGRPGQTF